MNRERKGHTLLELLAVIAVLVVVASISIPLIKPMLEDRQKDAAADVVRAKWSQARNKAMNANRPYAFEYKPDTGKFRVVPEEDDMNDGDLADMAHELELPGEIKFGTNGEGDVSKNGWSKVTFLPDGTAKYSSEISIGSGAQSITLKVHGATGVVSTAEGKR